ncbi:hypothetical protein C0989_000658 [Termitomyces sp. Mn162]|nr:hypothetical protein C0989_000658 [Termitomyces sp. Mn162]
MSARKRAGPLALSNAIEDDPNHHLTGPFLPQTPFSATPRSQSPVSPTLKAWAARPVSPWLRWATQPSSAAKLLLVPVILYLNWELTAPYLAPGWKNPFGAFFLISGLVPTSSPDDPRYQKTYLDLLFIAYNVIFFSLVRQLIVIKVCTPVARYFGLRKSGKIERFGEQGYALVYFGFFGAWGYVSDFLLSTIPHSNLFLAYHVTAPDILVPDRVLLDWSVVPFLDEFLQSSSAMSDYPHWDMKPELKRYYLMQMGYWLQQLIVLVLGLEKPRKDYTELVAHHIVTLWLVGYAHNMDRNRCFSSIDLF